MVIHLDKLRWLLWLRWKVFSRSFTRNATMRILGTVTTLLFVIGFFGATAIGTLFGYRFLSTPANTELLFLVLTGLYVLWIVLPLFEISANEGFDLSKLELFPITRGELMASLIISTLLDIPTLGLFFVLGAVVVGWATSLPLALFVLLAMLIFYIQLVGIGQLVLALLLPLLQNRRFRDLSIILTFLLVSCIYIFYQIAIHVLVTTNFLTLLTHAVFSPYLQWLPPGMAARAIQQATVGNWGVGFIWLVTLALISIMVLYLWQLLVAHSLTTAESGGTVRSTRQRRVSSALVSASIMPGMQTQTGLLGKLLPDQVLTLVRKDMKYLWRDPQLKAMLLQSFMSIGVIIIILFFDFGNKASLAGAGPWTVMLAPAIILFSLFTLSYNVLGLERQSLTTLFLFPIPPRYILWAKNITVMLLGVVEVLVLVLLSAALTHAWAFIVPGIVVGFTSICIIVGIGNITSTFMPQQMRSGLRGFRTTSNMSVEGGCLRGFMSALSVYGTLFIMIPVGLGVILPYIHGALWVWAITLPASLLYGLTIYSVILILVAPRILKKAPEILGLVVKE